MPGCKGLPSRWPDLNGSISGDGPDIYPWESFGGLLCEPLRGFLCGKIKFHGAHAKASVRGGPAFVLLRDPAQGGVRGPKGPGIKRVSQVYRLH